MDQPSSSSSTAKHPEQAEKSEKPFNPANVPPPVQGVPVATGPPGYYPEQQYYANRPVGYGSYATQGAPGVASNPYHPPVPTSFEVHEVRPQEPLPCLCGVQLVLFIFGWFFPVLWYFGAFMPLCMRRIDPREKLGWLANSVASVVFIIVLIIVFTRYHTSWGPYYGYSNKY